MGLNLCCGFLREGAGAGDVTFDDVAAHVEHWLDLGGEGVIALGADFDGATVPAFLDGARTLPSLQALLARRFGEEVCERLCSGNALAFFERVGRGR